METSRAFPVIICLSVFIAITWAYPTTVPPSPEVCSKMTPGHGPSPQKSQSPYTLAVSTANVQGGNNVQVTLSGNGHTFKGFYIQARDSTGSRVGTFIPDEGVAKVHTCGGIKNNAAHHSGKDDKSDVAIYWKAPQEYSGEVTFVATFVQEFETFWTQVKSEPVTVSSFLNSDITTKPAFTDSREERETPKATQESRVLNYNPYSPFSPLRNQDFDSPQFLSYMTKTEPQIAKVNASSRIMVDTEPMPDSTSSHSPAESSNFPISSNSRIRKSYYIPKPFNQNDAVIIQDGIENCNPQRLPLPIKEIQFTQHPFIEPPAPPTIPNRYSFLRDPPLFVAATPGPQQGGFHFLGDSKPLYNFKPQQPTKFQDSLTHNFRPSYFASDANSGWTGGVGHSGHIPKNTQHFRNPHSLSGGVPQIQGYNHQHGLLVNDYNVINTGIVLPKDMQSFMIPRYGYLVFNPKRGPPFYLIPAEPEAFERNFLSRGSSLK